MVKQFSIIPTFQFEVIDKRAARGGGSGQLAVASLSATPRQGGQLPDGNKRAGNF
jgi:hypothetical protein